MTFPHNAPPVVYPVGRSRFLGVALCGLWLAGALLVAGAWWGGHLPGWRVLVAGGCVLLAGAQAWHFWRRVPHGSLRWDGAGWWLECGAGPVPARSGALQLHLDLQRHLLLAWWAPPAIAPRSGLVRLAGRGRRYWLWADAQADAARWHDLRCAVYSSSAKTDVPDGAADP